MNSNLFLTNLINEKISLAKSSINNNFKNLLSQYCEENDLNLQTPESTLPQKDVKSSVELTNLAIDALNFDLKQAYEKNPEARTLAKKLLDLKNISSSEGPESLRDIISLIRIDNPQISFNLDTQIDYEVFSYLINLIKDLIFVTSKDFDSSLISKDLSNLKQSENLDPVTAEKMATNIQKKLQEFADSSITPPDVT